MRTAASCLSRGATRSLIVISTRTCFADTKKRIGFADFEYKERERESSQCSQTYRWYSFALFCASVCMNIEYSVATAETFLKNIEENLWILLLCISI